MTKLEARVKGVNRCHAYANELYPRLRAVFEPFVGQKIVKVTGGLLQKVEDKVKALDLPYTASLSVYRSSSDYSLVYRVKTCESGENYCFYYEASVYIGDLKNGVLVSLQDTPLNLRTDYSAQEIEIARKRYKELQEAADEAKSELFPFGEYDR